MPREGFRPFTKLVTVTSKDPVTVSLKDTGDDAVRCNYVKVEPVSGTAAAGLFYVIPIGPNVEKPTILSASGLPVDATASGNLGAVASTSNGSVILSLIKPDTVEEIRVSHTDTAELVYGITYGVVHESNPIGDERADKGN